MHTLRLMNSRQGGGRRPLQASPVNSEDRNPSENLKWTWENPISSAFGMRRTFSYLFQGGRRAVSAFCGETHAQMTHHSNPNCHGHQYQVVQWFRSWIEEA